MTSTTDMHRDALDQALRIALGTSQPALRQQALVRAASHLIHPRLILESPLLSDSHPWRKEGLWVSDAFEAVTNGMEQPGVLEALEDLEPDSPFQDWRHLILAIHFFYEGLDEAVTTHLNAIPLSSPVRTIAQTLESLLQGNSDGGTGPQRRLAQQVARPDPAVQQWVQDVAEGLETGDEGLFWGALSDWLDAVASQTPEKAKAAVLWTWNQLEWREFDEAILLDLGTSLWGKAESYRLAALGTVPWDPEGASLLWLRFLLTAIREGSIEKELLAEGRTIADRFRAAAEYVAKTEDGKETWNSLSRAWNTEVLAREWIDLVFAPPVPNGATPVLSHRADDGQLDLFA